MTPTGARCAASFTSLSRFGATAVASEIRPLHYTCTCGDCSALSFAREAVVRELVSVGIMSRASHTTAYVMLKISYFDLSLQGFWSHVYSDALS